MQIRSPIPPRLLAGNREKIRSIGYWKLSSVIFIITPHPAPSSCFFFFKKKCRRHLVFFFLRMRAYHHGPRHPLRVRVHYSTKFSLFQFLALVIVRNAEERRGLWRNKFTWQFICGSFWLWKICASFPPMPPILASIGLTKTNERRACGNSCHPLFVCPICSFA